MTEKREPISAGLRNLRIALLGLLVNLTLAIIKLLAGLLGNSYALIADAVESMADIFGSVVVWGGIRIARQPPDEKHPYGHGKAEALAALVVGMMLVGAAIGIAVEAVRDVSQRQESPAAFTLWVLLAVVAVKETMYRIGRRAEKKTGSSAIGADAWHHRSDAITSVAAAIGITIALIGGEGYEAADNWAAIFASAIILFNAVRIMRPPLSELMDAEQGDIAEQARRIAVAVKDVGDVEKVCARKSGTSYWVDMHIEVEPAMSVNDAHDLAHRVKDAVRKKMPEVEDVLVHIEPLGRRGNGDIG
ncbi:MAG: cation transporter [Phycisphaerales bacterium]|nr:MAG: cation transporter [Phycisphaerales bacterium]